MGQVHGQLCVGRQGERPGPYSDHPCDGTRIGGFAEGAASSGGADRHACAGGSRDGRSGERDRRTATERATRSNSRSPTVSGRKTGGECRVNPARRSGPTSKCSASYTTGAERDAGGQSQLPHRDAAGLSVGYSGSTCAGNPAAGSRQTTRAERFADRALIS